MSDEEKLDLIGCGVNIGSRWSKQNTIAEFEKIKAKIQKENCTKCCLPHIIKECNNSKTGRDWCEYYVCLKAINENISELKGENNGT